MKPTREQIFKKKPKEFSEEDIVEVHHNLMVAYNCWIPIEEFKKIPLPTLWSLMPLVNEELERREEGRQSIVAIAKSLGMKKK